jgi:hypothetical protein
VSCARGSAGGRTHDRTARTRLQLVVVVATAAVHQSVVESKAVDEQLQGLLQFGGDAHIRRKRTWCSSNNANNGLRVNEVINESTIAHSLTHGCTHAEAHPARPPHQHTTRAAAAVPTQQPCLYARTRSKLCRVATLLVVIVTAASAVV